MLSRRLSLGAALCWLPRASCVPALPMHRKVIVLALPECAATRSRAGRKVAASPKLSPVYGSQLEREHHGHTHAFPSPV